MSRGLVLCVQPIQGPGFLGTLPHPFEATALANEVRGHLEQRGLNPAQCALKLVGPENQAADALSALAGLPWKSTKAVARQNPFDVQYRTDAGLFRVERDAEASPASSPVALAPLASARSSGPIRVLVIDDSATIRNLLQKTLSSDPAIEVVGMADGPSQAEKMIESLKPHVLTLDIHMPEMDGVTFLKRSFPKHRLPTIMISSISMEEGPMVLEALEAGAVDYIQKPSFDQLSVVAPQIIEKVKTAAAARVREKSTAPRAPKVDTSRIDVSSSLLAIGSSTGGTEALREVFSHFPDKIPGVVVVQHIPPVFSKAFADRMNSLFPFEVKEAEDNDQILPNRILIAPGAKQMRVKLRGSELRVSIDDSEPVNRHKPSVDVLFDSLLNVKNYAMSAAILTGMGSDGARAMKRLHDSGIYTIAQNEQTCVVYGMPRAAVEMKATSVVVPLGDVAGQLLRNLNTRKNAA